MVAETLFGVGALREVARAFTLVTRHVSAFRAKEWGGYYLRSIGTAFLV